MKKKMKQLCCILTAVILCLSMLTPVYAASSKYNTAVKKYRKYMNSENSSNKCYKIVDIDGNGVPELLFHTWTDNRVCTYNPKTKRVVCLGIIGCGKGYYLPIAYSRKTHCVMISNANTGGNIKEIYKINGTKAKLVVRAEAFNGKFDSGYKVNGKKVRKSTYNKMIKKYMKKTVTMNIPHRVW